MKNPKLFRLLDIIIIIIVTSIISGLTSGVIIYNSYEEKSGFTYAELTDDLALKEFLSVYYSILDEYYEQIDNEEMLDKAMDAMLQYLGDDYSNYLTESETKALIEKLKGTYEGLGISITTEKIILEVFKDSPAEKAGIKVNDKLIKVNEIDVTEKSSSDAAKYIGESTGNIDLVVLRNNKEYSFTLKKTTLNVPAILTEIISKNNKKVGYISISTFSETLAEQVSKSLEEMDKENINGLIIDVRGNSGGYLTAATGVANLFLEKGKVIYSLEGKEKTDVIKDDTNDKKNYKIVVLIDEGSASASEILAAALKDSYGAILVGNTSFGKGKVQQTKTLSNGSMIKYTSAKWLRPNGNCIDGIGIIPDYNVSLEIIQDKGNKIQEVKDTQKNKAIELLTK